MRKQDIGVFKFMHINLPGTVHNTFFYLNQSDLAPKIAGDLEALHIQFGDEFQQEYYTSLGVFVAGVQRGCVGATPLVAGRLGLKEGENVLVSAITVNSLSAVAIRPKTQDDYDIIMNAAGIMEYIMMDQVRVVAPRQKLPLKVGNIVIDVIVDNLKPSGKCGRLEKYTEVEILDPSTKYEQVAIVSNTLEPSHTITNVVYTLLRWGFGFWRTKEPPPNKHVTKEEMLATFKNPPKRNVEYRVVLEKSLHGKPDIVYTSCGGKKTPTPCKVTKVPERIGVADFKKESDCFVFSIVAARADSASSPTIYLTKYLMGQLKVEIGSRVVIEELSELPDKGDAANDTNIGETCPVDHEEVGIYLWKSIREMYSQVTHELQCFLSSQHSSSSLITGPIGCGRTFLLKKLAHYCTDQNFYCTTVDCKNLRGKKPESLVKIFAAKFSECAFREPSVLLLDDLDSLMYLPNEHEEEPSSASLAYCRRVAHMLTEFHENYSKISQICLIATASAVHTLGPLTTTRGPRLFGLVNKIPEMAPEEREEVLKWLGVAVSRQMAEKTHGYRIQDLVDLVGRAKLRALVEEREVQQDDYFKALHDTTPMALQGAQLHVDIPYTWADIGGLHSIKKLLDEIFRWPSQFPHVFAMCPLRLQTGALLYGAPGCGKTLLAGALANECGMNFISVKGPELLSKYVGQSEAGVRNLFERAKHAKPCLLFFDELDSLAPKRGADTTGVTDRVVNQMLTELDGVEGREGVWVLGASSRPDLIDPALLRPGRLDRPVYCPLPDQNERSEILKILSGSVCLEDDVSLDGVAESTDGFTGADLQALLYNAQMHAIKEKNRDDDVDVRVSNVHVDSALSETRPSLSKADRFKYQQIFKRFQSKKDLKADPMSQMQQKVTFA